MKRCALLVLALAACDRSSASVGGATAAEPPKASAAAAPAAPAEPIVVTSTAFAPNGAIPAAHTCDGKDAMPALAWTRSPPQATAQALIVDDPDAPGGVFTHLVAWNMSADARSIAEGTSPATEGAQLGKNDFGKKGWSGPCPPKGAPHRYRFRVVALDKPLAGLGPETDGAALDAALKGHVMAEGVLVGTYQR